jgi:hypothetical protein
VGTAQAVTPILPEPLAGPVYIVQQAANPLPKLAVFLDGLVSIRLDAQNEIQHVQIVNTFDGLPDVPLTSFEIKINGGRNGILKNFSSLCQKEFRGDVAFTAQSGKTFSAKPLLEVPACESASSAPRTSITLTGVRSGAPTLTVRVRRALGGANIRRLQLSLPSALRTSGRRSVNGVLVRSARRLERSHWKLSRGALSVKLPKAGAASVQLVLGRGALKSSARLRSASRFQQLRFRLLITDAANHHFRITRKVRPRS